MRFAIPGVVSLVLLAYCGRAQTAQESKLNLEPYGLVKTGCLWYPGRVEFLDDDRLVVSAPVRYTCDARDRDKPIDTRIAVIDLEGHELAAIRRTDVVESAPGPNGYFAVCTGDRLELLAGNLQVANSIALAGAGRFGVCNFRGELSPSRNTMLISGPGNSQFRLYRGAIAEPIAEITTKNGQSVWAITDDGFLVCDKEKKQCEVVGAHGKASGFAVPQLAGSAGYSIVGLVAPDRLLLVGFNGEHLLAETPAGETVSMGDVARLKPPYIDGDYVEMSAAEPRRILYQVDGCLLGDFDDCYGVVFRRFAVFDSQTSRMLFRHSYPPGVNYLKISPNGHIVMAQAGSQVQLFRLP